MGALGTLVLSPAGCGSEAEVPLIDREAFVSAYVELRAAALRNRGELDEGRRDQILAEHGVSGEDLIAFVEGHGAELEFMRAVWNEIETRLDSVPPLEP